MPAASTVETAVAPAADMETLLTTLKALDGADLFKVIKQIVAEAERRSKGSVSRSKAPVAKKAGSMPKGVVPPQLRKPRAWVDFTLQHALENGWETFTVFQSKKNKVTGEREEEEIEMPASVLHEGAHVYDGSVTEKTPAGRQLIHKDAMSLSKQRWAPKEKAGTHPELYAEFEASYGDDDGSDASETASEASSTKKAAVRKTAAEKAAEQDAKKVAKEAEKEAKKAEKEAEKAAKKAEKEAEKEAKKAEKEAEKAAKKAEKEAAKKPAAAKSVVPAAAMKKAQAAVLVDDEPLGTPVKAAKKAPVAAPKKAEWTCPADGMVHAWSYKGKQYLRNSDNEIWLKGADGGCGEWQGIYLPAEDRIDDSIPEPVFDDEE
jgi:hypothetical protein